MSGDGIKLIIAKDNILSWFVLGRRKEYFKDFCLTVKCLLIIY